MNKKYTLFTALFLMGNIAYSQDLKTKNLYNKSAYISSQCYTKTVNDLNENILHNPCFSCHTKNKEPNFTLADEDLQEAYDFPQEALKNPWLNLFKDRTKQIETILDDEILAYVKEDNYKNEDGKIILENKLKNLSNNWDFNENGKWDGYIPDVSFNFDEEGFDKDINGVYTGWRAFAYYPFLGTFWPTNGSFDDVLIRLPKSFYINEKGLFDKELYLVNLAIVESLIKQKTVKIKKVDERKYGFDLNQNKKLDFANEVVFHWKTPKFDVKTNRLKGFSMSYVGEAKKLLEEGKLKIAPGLYPVGTEFAHTVRYLDIKDGEVKMASRMKEFRYAKKHHWNNYTQLLNAGYAEIKEKHDFPDRLDTYLGNMEIGLSNKRGWLYQGFIEDKKGDLRPQTYEETLYCMGCHSNIGVTADSTFVFQRKFEGEDMSYGWYHWSKKDLKGVKDRVLEDGQTEYVRYLKLNNAGDEFRANDEIMEKFFVQNWQEDKKNIEKDLISKLEEPNLILKQEWKLKKDEIEKLKEDITHLIIPSKKRALQLNKAYKIIVDEQSYIYGRDTNIKPATNVHKVIKKGQMTHLQKVER